MHEEIGGLRESEGKVLVNMHTSIPVSTIETKQRGCMLRVPSEFTFIIMRPQRFPEWLTTFRLLQKNYFLVIGGGMLTLAYTL